MAGLGGAAPPCATCQTRVTAVSFFFFSSMELPSGPWGRRGRPRTRTPHRPCACSSRHLTQRSQCCETAGLPGAESETRRDDASARAHRTQNRAYTTPMSTADTERETRLPHVTNSALHRMLSPSQLSTVLSIHDHQGVAAATSTPAAPTSPLAASRTLSSRVTASGRGCGGDAGRLRGRDSRQAGFQAGAVQQASNTKAGERAKARDDSWRAFDSRRGRTVEDVQVEGDRRGHVLVG